MLLSSPGKVQKKVEHIEKLDQVCPSAASMTLKVMGTALISPRTVRNLELEWRISNGTYSLYTYSTYSSGLIMAVCPVP